MILGIFTGFTLIIAGCVVCWLIMRWWEAFEKTPPDGNKVIQSVLFDWYHECPELREEPPQ